MRLLILIVVSLNVMQSYGYSSLIDVLFSNAEGRAYNTLSAICLNGSVNVPDFENCHKWYRCDKNSIATQKYCADGAAYIPEKETCSKSAQCSVKYCRTSLMKPICIVAHPLDPTFFAFFRIFGGPAMGVCGFTDDSKTTKLTFDVSQMECLPACVDEGKMAYPSKCHKWIHCLKKGLELVRNFGECPAKKSFDINTGTCIDNSFCDHSTGKDSSPVTSTTTIIIGSSTTTSSGIITTSSSITSSSTITSSTITSSSTATPTSFSSPPTETTTTTQTTEVTDDYDESTDEL